MVDRLLEFMRGIPDPNLVILDTVYQHFKELNLGVRVAQNRRTVLVSGLRCFSAKVP